MLRAASLIACFALPALLLAQTGGTIQAQGSATLSASPDQAQLVVGVSTDAATAQAAAQSNATISTAVVTALKQVLGSAGTVQTLSYSINPHYPPGQSQNATGFTVVNTLQVTTSDLSSLGNLIDAANQAGANIVNSLMFTLMNPDPLKQQALGQAAKQALAHAGAIASGLGVKAGAVVSAQEGVSVTPVVYAGAAAPVSTPIQTGQVSVTATVTITAQLSQ